MLISISVTHSRQLPFSEKMHNKQDSDLTREYFTKPANWGREVFQEYQTAVTLHSDSKMKPLLVAIANARKHWGTIGDHAEARNLQHIHTHQKILLAVILPLAIMIHCLGRNWSLRPSQPALNFSLCKDSGQN